MYRKIYSHANSIRVMMMMMMMIPLCDHKRDWHLIGLWLTCCVTVVSSFAMTIR